MREGAVNDRPRKIGILTALGFVLAAATAGAQMSGGQASAAKSAASQARTGQRAGSVNAPARPAAQAPVPTPAAPTATAPTGGRRDPFRPLIVKGKGDEIPARLPPGKAGLVIGQLTVQGIVRGLGGEWIGVVDNKTKRAYFLYAGDELFNGTVSRITVNSIVFEERLMDPAGRQRSREVVKQLAPK
jgi:hypothetical protein